MPNSAPLLDCRSISKSFPGVQALAGVRFDIRAGEVHALVGENGAGKSTLMKILAGAQAPDSGAILIDGQPRPIADARAARALGIAIVYQEFNLVPDLSVGENIFLGRWPLQPWTRSVDFVQLHSAAARVIASLGIALDSRLPVGSLSVAQQQMVEIAKALSLDARVLILDEPSAVLTPHELVTLFKVVRDVTRRGVGVAYISHRLDEIFDLADRVTVFRDGQHISTREIGETDRRRLITEMVGRPLEEEFPARECTIGDSAIVVEALGVPGRFAGVTLDVRTGEVFGLTGLVGAGRSSVLGALFGAVHGVTGRVRVTRHVGPFRSPRQAMRCGLASLPEDRKGAGLLLHRSVRENLTLANLGAYATAGVLDLSRERQAATRLIDELQIRTSGPEVAVGTLSGGNQQKVLLARWMDRAHDAVLFDEPTRGVDVGAKYEIYQLINRLAGAGVAVLMVSSELPEVIGMCDRIGVMHEGQLQGILDNGRRQVSQTAIMTLAAGEAA